MERRKDRWLHRDGPGTEGNSIILSPNRTVNAIVSQVTLAETIKKLISRYT
jgi:hypothetical protein